MIVTDTLSEDLDMLSFEQGVASNAFDVSFKPGRVVEWRFDNINLPDSNANEAASHGLVTFRIKPVLPLLPGTTIENIANIYFDFNEPVITDPSVLVAEFSTGMVERQRDGVKLYPNPANDHVRVSWPAGTPINAPWALVAADGRIVLNGRTTGSEETIDIHTAATGAYMLRLQTNEGVSTITLLRSTHP